MTVLTTTDRTTGQGNGVTTTFDYDFLMPDADYAVVTFTDTDGTETIIAAGDYNITGVGNPLGGSVEYPLVGSPIATGTSLTIQRVLPATQTTVLGNQSAFYPETVEEALDYVTMLVQQYLGEEERALRVPASEDSIDDIPAVDARALQLLGFDADGQPIAAEPSSALVSSAMQPVVASSTLAAARTAMGVELWGGTGGGTANAQTITCTGFTLEAGRKLRFKAAATNTGALTIAINGGAATAVRKLALSGLTALTGYEIVSGNVYDILYDGTVLVMMPLPLAGYVLGSVQTFTASGTWTKPAGCRAVLVEVVGGGGGGGGAPATGGAQTSTCGGGGAGGYSRKWITTAAATETVTVGAGGAGGIGGGAAAGAGGTTSFGAHLSATGGALGPAGATTGSVVATTPGGLGGIGSSGDINARGGGGTLGVGSANGAAVGGNGGSSHYGGGGLGGDRTDGGAGGAYGGGGGGSSNTVSAIFKTGGAGAAGVVTVLEYY